jgi:hypothetical protein
MSLIGVAAMASFSKGSARGPPVGFGKKADTIMTTPGSQFSAISLKASVSRARRALDTPTLSGVAVAIAVAEALARWARADEARAPRLAPITMAAIATPDRAREMRRDM